MCLLTLPTMEDGGMPDVAVAPPTTRPRLTAKTKPTIGCDSTTSSLLLFTEDLTPAGSNNSADVTLRWMPTPAPLAPPVSMLQGVRREDCTNPLAHRSEDEHADRRESKTSSNMGDHNYASTLSTLSPGVDRGVRLTRPPHPHRKHELLSKYASPPVDVGTRLARASNIPSTVEKR